MLVIILNIVIMKGECELFEFIVNGTAFSSVDSKKVKCLKNHLFCISKKGVIEAILSPDTKEYQETIEKYRKLKKYHVLSEEQLLLPGFIDLHVHAPQWAQIGTALDIPLHDWLNTYTFPLESKFSDEIFAEKVYSDLVSQLIANGTTTVLYFGTIHRTASRILAEICCEKGQRGLVGKVVMDDKEENPDYYRDESTARALAETEAFILDIQKLSEKAPQGVYPVITPRFIPSCTDDALKGLGELAKKYNVHVQSHCSESDWEHNFVQNRLNKNDAVALNDFGLLTEKSVMAHCGYLSEDDMKLFAEKGTAVAHCPISNAYLGHAVTPIAKLLYEYKIKVGLGTDISGGFSPSQFDNIKQAVISSRMLEDGVDNTICHEKRGVPNSRITLNEAFYLATAGGGKALGLSIGKLEVGYAWDVQVINLATKQTPITRYFSDENLMDTFQKVLYLARPENIQEVWIQGRKVHENLNYLK